MPEDGENDDKWIMVTTVKQKNYLTPNSNPNCIMHLPYSPNPAPPPTTTHPALHNKWRTTKPSCPQAHESTAGSKKSPGASTSSKHYSAYAKVTICSLTTVLLGLPNVDKIRPTTWVQRSIEPSKSLQSKNMSVSPNRTKSTYLMLPQPLVSC
jgi:hypothetical protein